MFRSFWTLSSVMLFHIFNVHISSLISICIIHSGFYLWGPTYSPRQIGCGTSGYKIHGPGHPLDQMSKDTPGVEHTGTVIPSTGWANQYQSFVEILLLSFSQVMAFGRIPFTKSSWQFHLYNANQESDSNKSIKSKLLICNQQLTKNQVHNIVHCAITPRII